LVFDVRVSQARTVYPYRFHKGALMAWNRTGMGTTLKHWMSVGNVSFMVTNSCCKLSGVHVFCVRTEQIWWSADTPTSKRADATGPNPGSPVAAFQQAATTV
jgi:hypothetical protein